MNLTDFSGVGAVTLSALSDKGLHKAADLLTVFPKGYKDTRVTTDICDIDANHFYLIEGVVSNITYKNFGKKILRFVVTDDTGSCEAVLFRFYPNQINMLENAEMIRCYGQPTVMNRTQMIHPEWAVMHGDKCSIEKKITPIYNLKKISDKLISKIIIQTLHDGNVADFMPSEYLNKYDILSFTDSLYYVHALASDMQEKHLLKARYSIMFEEMVAYKLAEDSVNKDFKQSVSPVLNLGSSDIDELLSKLPYSLTAAQIRVIGQILGDISQKKTMTRLLQGDVGSGKTIVATVAMYAAHKSGYQSVIVAPTEILAEQHYKLLSEFLTNVVVVPLLGKLTAKQTRDSLDKIKNVENAVIVGTHSVFQERVEYKNLGLVIVDEQHRFGVEQRLSLIKKGSNITQTAPHQLIISATPIPRTLSMTLCGNLKLSVIDELPPNRKPIVTTILNRAKKYQLIAKLKQAISRKEQIYWVCPLVEESESLGSLQDVKTLYEELVNELGGYKVGLVYGSMKSKDKIQVMDDFKSAKFDVLVATTVIEVGVDVPNASIMVIDNSERLGISQLHQLRGRVGRGSKASYCVLMYSDNISQVGKTRVSLLRESQDGFYLAEKDLEIRGAGDILGKEQSGITNFATFDINEYYDHHEKVFECAEQLKNTHPEISKKIVARWFNKRINYVDV